MKRDGWRRGAALGGVLAAVGVSISGVVSSLSTSETADVAGLAAAVFSSVCVVGVSHRLWHRETVADAGAAGPAAAFAA